MTIYDLIAITPIFVGGALIWRHINISQAAKTVAWKHCENAGVQLLDQSIILKKISIAKSTSSIVALRRLYAFEFSTVGDIRYSGRVSMVGNQVEQIELSPFKI